ncbi:hypothetical protein [Lentzea sp. E54]
MPANTVSRAFSPAIIGAILFDVFGHYGSDILTDLEDFPADTAGL